MVFHAKECQINCVETPMEGKHELPLLVSILCIVTFFQRKLKRVQYRSNSTWRNLTMTFSQVIKVKINSQKC